MKLPARSAHGSHSPSTCDCPAHRAERSADAAGRRSGLVASLLPALACAVCPACLATYAKALSYAGLSMWLSEREHGVFLVVSVVLSLGIGFRRARALDNFRPFAVTVFGCALLVAGHVFEEQAGWVSWLGLVALFVGSVYAHRARPRAAKAFRAVDVGSRRASRATALARPAKERRAVVAGLRASRPSRSAARPTAATETP